MRRRLLLAVIVLFALPLQAEEGKDKPKWDVSNPPGPRHDVTIDVDEGTWMSVDVSPDGKDIVFDLLGDIYLMPIAGGAARSLTTGIAWDMQPRFSPDGKRIAFTSDRGGGDNLWVMNRDGSDPKAVSSESFRLVNSPAWTSDGEYVVGRKHFTSKRSLGAGEIWMWHRSGGEGIQVTEKQTDQKDTGEPALSPDGRYLYYSQDDTPGKTFEYNKDPNGEIYVIHRYDRQRGEDDAFVTGPGGSVRPTPSPDGKSLAFLRRIRGKTVLMTADVATGAERILTDGLERDLQETWAIHGVYPQIAWTPDSRSVVYWAGGKIRRVDVASQKVAVIPFQVKGTRSVAETLRFPQEVAPPKLRPKMLRWARVSPDGKQVVFQALGRLYLKDLPAGKPRPLTKQRDHFEYYPAWSRDGRSIVYASWDDEQGGAVRVVPAAGGEGRAVTPAPGHYVEPAFSPDGKKIVYRKTSDGYLRTPRWGRDRGLYWVPTAGGTPQRIVKEGEQPVFAAAGDRVYFVRYELSPVDKDPDKMTLRSINLDGGEERTHLVSEEAIEYRVSPDERWVAFVQNFNIWLAPLPKTGKPVNISPKTKAYPVARLSRDAGEWLGWSSDSRRLYWSLGPELFSREVNQAFDFVPGAPAALPKPADKGIDLSFDVDADVPDGALALVGGRVVTMRGDEVIEDGAVVVEKNRIVAVGPRRGVTIPRGAKTIDVAGATIVPGLVDVHWHGAMGGEQIIPEQSWVDYATLAFGVTTIHDPSNDTTTIFAHSELGRAGLVVAPRIFSTGTIIYGAKGAEYRAPIDSPEDARAHLRRIQAAGGFSVKNYNQPRREQRQEIIAAARDLNMMVVPEGGSLFDLDMTFIIDGHTGVEHALPVANVYADVLALWSGSQTGYTPTLIVAYGGHFGEGWFYQHDAVWKNERLLSFVPRRFVNSKARRPTMIPDDELNHIAVARAVKALADKGVVVNLGAHGQREGLGAHWEMAMLVQGGMTPHQALRAGTLSGAHYLGLDKHIGSIEVGKLADLAIIDGNPLADIAQSSRVRYVMVNGRLYDAATMNEIGNRPRPRKPFWFEGPDGNQGLRR